MDHNQMSQHWGYPGTASTADNSSRNAWAPVTRGIKRTAISDSDDCEDVFSEESSKEQCTSPGNADSCQMLSRKKRRGVIEKKRRDRINTSLTELKRLVPSAYEKQGSAKLEKAEILQMTVDHLKMLHAKGLDNLAYDPHKFAMDYHIIGFRECATEVARYLVTIEGMDIQDPLRLRLMSHLQCFVTQRELASKQASASGTSSGWGYGPSHTAPPPPPPPVVPSPSSQHYTTMTAGPTGPVANPVNLLHHPQPTSLHHHVQHPNIHDPGLGHYDLSATSCATSPSRHHSTTSALTSGSSTLTQLTSTTSSLGYPGPPHQYVPNAYPVPTGAPTSLSSSLQNYNQSNASSQMKPYRPWGAEVAY